MFTFCQQKPVQVACVPLFLRNIVVPECVTSVCENYIMLTSYNFIWKLTPEEVFHFLAVTRQKELCIRLFNRFNELFKGRVFGKKCLFDVPVFISAVTSHIFRIF